MREWLIAKRKAKGLNLAQMAHKCRCSMRLLHILEVDDGITHPDIAAWVAREYGLKLEEYNKLVHESKRAKKAIPAPKEPPTLSEFYEDKYARNYRWARKNRSESE